MTLLCTVSEFSEQGFPHSGVPPTLDISGSGCIAEPVFFCIYTSCRHPAGFQYTSDDLC